MVLVLVVISTTLLSDSNCHLEALLTLAQCDTTTCLRVAHVSSRTRHNDAQPHL
jgi:hypothetical protein